MTFFFNKGANNFWICNEFHSAQEPEQRPGALTNPNGRGQKKAGALLECCPLTAQADVV
jgi:hypothetical protein